MKYTLSIILIMLSFGAFAQSTSEKVRGCLVNLNKKSLGIDPSCKCKERNICFKFNPVKQSDKLLEITDKAGKSVYSREFKNKSRESAKVFNQIIDLKSQGKGSSAEIKELYVMLDKLNTDLRKNLLANHGSYFIKIKSNYQKQLNQAKVREIRLKDRIAKYLNDPKSQISSIKSSLASSTATKSENLESTKSKQESIDKANENENLLSSNNVNLNRPGYSSEILERDRAKEMAKSLERMDLERKDDDSIFDILSKRYMKRYPNLLID